MLFFQQQLAFSFSMAVFFSSFSTLLYLTPNVFEFVVRFGLNLLHSHIQNAVIQTIFFSFKTTEMPIKIEENCESSWNLKMHIEPSIWHQKKKKSTQPQDQNSLKISDENSVKFVACAKHCIHNTSIINTITTTKNWNCFLFIKFYSRKVSGNTHLSHCNSKIIFNVLMHFAYKFDYQTHTPSTLPILPSVSLLFHLY